MNNNNNIGNNFTHTYQGLQQQQNAEPQQSEEQDLRKIALLQGRLNSYGEINLINGKLTEEKRIIDTLVVRIFQLKTRLQLYPQQTSELQATIEKLETEWTVKVKVKSELEKMLELAREKFDSICEELDQPCLQDLGSYEEDSEDSQSSNDNSEQEVESFSYLDTYKNIDMEVDENIELLHIALYQMTFGKEGEILNSTINALIEHIQSDTDLLTQFKSSIAEEPNGEYCNYLSFLSRTILQKNEWPEWVKSKPADNERQKSDEDVKDPYFIGIELINLCLKGEIPENYQDLKLLEPIHWNTLKDQQKRSPLHILLSQGELNEKRIDAACQLVGLCPGLLTFQDSSGETPIDILYRKNNMQSISLLLNKGHTIAPDNDNNENKSVSLLKILSCICYAKEAKVDSNLIRYLLGIFQVDIQMSVLNEELIDSIPLHFNPVFVCTQLNKIELAEFIIKKFRFHCNCNSPNNGEIPGSVVKLLQAVFWRDKALVQKYWGDFQSYFEEKFYDKVKNGGLHPSQADFGKILNRLIEMGCFEEVDGIFDYMTSEKLSNYDELYKFLLYFLYIENTVTLNKIKNLDYKQLI